MRQAVKAALLSGLVFPGTGQLGLKRIARGMAFMGSALVCLVMLVTATVHELMPSLENLDPSDPNAIAALAGQSGQTSMDSLYVALLLVCWLWSTLDAFRLGWALDQQSRD